MANDTPVLVMTIIFLLMVGGLVLLGTVEYIYAGKQTVVESAKDSTNLNAEISVMND